MVVADPQEVIETQRGEQQRVVDGCKKSTDGILATIGPQEDDRVADDQERVAERVQQRLVEEHSIELAFRFVHTSHKTRRYRVRICHAEREHLVHFSLDVEEVEHVDEDDEYESRYAAQEDIRDHLYVRVELGVDLVHPIGKHKRRRLHHSVEFEEEQRRQVDDHRRCEYEHCQAAERRVPFLVFFADCCRLTHVRCGRIADRKWCAIFHYFKAFD